MNAAVKIDKSFAGELERHIEDRATVQLVVDLAHTLGMRIVGEGVESAGQRAELKKVGRDMVQGFYLAKPLPREAAYELPSKEFLLAGEPHDR